MRVGGEVVGDVERGRVGVESGVVGEWLVSVIGERGIESGVVVWWG